VAEVGERLVTVLLTLVVPAEADPEDAAQLVADAAASSALQVAHATAVEGHLPVPGATVVRAGRSQPWLVVAAGLDRVALADLAGQVVHVPRRTVLPDPLDPAMLPAGAGAGAGCCRRPAQCPGPRQHTGCSQTPAGGALTTWAWAQLVAGSYGLPGPAVVTSPWVLQARAPRRGAAASLG